MADDVIKQMLLAKMKSAAERFRELYGEYIQIGDKTYKYYGFDDKTGAIKLQNTSTGAVISQDPIRLVYGVESNSLLPDAANALGNAASNNALNTTMSAVGSSMQGLQGVQSVLNASKKDYSKIAARLDPRDPNSDFWSPNKFGFDSNKGSYYIIDGENKTFFDITQLPNYQQLTSYSRSLLTRNWDLERTGLQIRESNAHINHQQALSDININEARITLRLDAIKYELDHGFKLGVQQDVDAFKLDLDKAGLPANAYFSDVSRSLQSVHDELNTIDNVVKTRLGADYSPEQYAAALKDQGLFDRYVTLVDQKGALLQLNSRGLSQGDLDARRLEQTALNGRPTLDQRRQVQQDTHALDLEKIKTEKALFDQEYKQYLADTEVLELPDGTKYYRNENGSYSSSNGNPVSFDKLRSSGAKSKSEAANDAAWKKAQLSAARSTFYKSAAGLASGLVGSYMSFKKGIFEAEGWGAKLLGGVGALGSMGLMAGSLKAMNGALMGRDVLPKLFGIGSFFEKGMEFISAHPGLSALGFSGAMALAAWLTRDKMPEEEKKLKELGEEIEPVVWHNGPVVALTAGLMLSTMGIEIGPRTQAFMEIPNITESQISKLEQAAGTSLQGSARYGTVFVQEDANGGPTRIVHLVPGGTDSRGNALSKAVVYTLKPGMKVAGGQPQGAYIPMFFKDASGKLQQNSAVLMKEHLSQSACMQIKDVRLQQACIDNAKLQNKDVKAQ